MSTLSQFFGAASTGGGTSVTSTMRVFAETGSYTLPSNTVYAAYGVMGGGGHFSQAVAGCLCCQRSGGGGGFSFKEGSHIGAATICAVVGQGGRPTCCCLLQMLSQGGTTCINGFQAGTICATGGDCNLPGVGSGGDINTRGGYGGLYQTILGGAGAGGLFGNGGDVRRGAGGGGFGSGGGGGGGYKASLCCHSSDPGCTACISPDVGLNAYYNSAQGGGGGQAGGLHGGGDGLAGKGGSSAVYVYCGASPSVGYQLERATGGYIPQYTKCGYSQAKTYFAAAGGGGAGVCATSVVQHSVAGGFANGAPGGGGGAALTCNHDFQGGHGGFGAGAGSGVGSNTGGISGFGGGGPIWCYDGSQNLYGGIGGQGVAVIEFWTE